MDLKLSNYSTTAALKAEILSTKVGKLELETGTNQFLGDARVEFSYQIRPRSIPKSEFRPCSIPKSDFRPRSIPKSDFRLCSKLRWFSARKTLVRAWRGPRQGCDA